MNTQKSAELYKEACQYFPGGVNSPVRAFKSVGGVPLFIVKGKGSRIYDADSNEYLDFCASWGPLILGHAHPGILKKITETIHYGTSFGAPTILENELARLILHNHPYIEKIRFVSSGTEAVMSAIRLARGYTGKNKIVKFEGCFHGHSDALLVKAGSGLVTFGNTSSAGIPEPLAELTLVVPLDNEEAIENCFKTYGHEIAAVIIEPIPANNGLLLQRAEFLQYLRKVCSEYNALLIFDEVISGFRVGFCGACGHYNIKPDIVTFGKIIGGGLPVGAYAASNEIMRHISPEGNVYQSGTLSGNPVAMAAGTAQLTECLKEGFYETLETRTLLMIENVRKHILENDYPVRIFSIASIFWFSFSNKETVRAAHDIDSAGMELFKKWYHYLLENGIYLGPSGYEVGFLSAAHTNEEIEKATDVFCKGLDFVFKK